MPDLPLTFGHEGRPRLDLPPVRCVNAFLEASPGGPARAVRSSRPGLTRTLNLGVGPILRSFQQPGFLNGDVFNVSGNTLYQADTALGTVAYSRSPRMAGAQTQLMLVVGGALYQVQSGAITPILTFDDGFSLLPPFSGCVVLYNIWIYPVVGSTQFYFSSVGDGSVINAANFGNAQTSPTPIIEVATLAEELYFFKAANGVEIWDFTGDLTAPFAESLGRTYPRGVAAQDSVVQADNALFWVGDDFVVYRTGTVPKDISTPYITDRLKKEAQSGTIAAMKGLRVEMEGHVYYVMNLYGIGESYAYDCQTQKWFQWGTQIGTRTEPAVFIGATSAGQGEQIFIGSANDGRVWFPDPSVHADDGAPIRVVVAGAIWMQGGVQRCNNVSLQTVRGVGWQSAPMPKVWMRYSDDGGNTWSGWMAGELGGPGGYRIKAVWRQLGLMIQPGRDFEFAVADAVNFTVESATYNEARV